MSQDQGSSQKSQEKKPKTNQVLGVVEDETPPPAKAPPKEMKAARFSWTQMSFSFI